MRIACLFAAVVLVSLASAAQAQEQQFTGQFTGQVWTTKVPYPYDAVNTSVMIEHFEVKLVEYSYQGQGKYGPKNTLFIGEEPSEEELKKRKLKKFGEQMESEEKSEDDIKK